FHHFCSLSLPSWDGRVAGMLLAPRSGSPCAALSCGSAVPCLRRGSRPFLAKRQAGAPLREHSLPGHLRSHSLLPRLNNAFATCRYLTLRFAGAIISERGMIRHYLYIVGTSF